MIVINLDVILAKRKMSLTELSNKVGITMANLSILKKGKARAIRFSTLEAICEALECQPSDILEYKKRPVKQKVFEYNSQLKTNNILLKLEKNLLFINKWYGYFLYI